MGKFIDLTGQRFGRLVVIKKSKKDRHGNYFWKCKCDCGVEKNINGQNLRRNQTISCGCYNIESTSKRFEKDIVGQIINHQKILEKEKRIKNDISYFFYKIKCEYCGKEQWIKRSSIFSRNGCGCKRYVSENLSGQVFGKLTAIKIVKKNKRGTPVWECQCSCGNIKLVTSAHLKSGNVQSCGCLWIKNIMLKEDISAINNIYSSYKFGALKRGLSFELNYNEFKLLISKDCYYCGNQPDKTKKGKIFNNRFGFFEKKDYFYNGIDRVDNSVGYTLENSVPCCKICNYSKKTMSREEFLSWIERVYNHSIKNNIIKESV